MGVSTTLALVVAAVVCLVIRQKYKKAMKKKSSKSTKPVDPGDNIRETTFTVNQFQDSTAVTFQTDMMKEATTVIPGGVKEEATVNILADTVNLPDETAALEEEEEEKTDITITPQNIVDSATTAVGKEENAVNVL